MSEVRGSQEETPCVRGQGRGPRGATLHLSSGTPGGANPPWRSEAAPEARGSGRDEQPKERWLQGVGGPFRSYPTLKIRKGSGKELPLVQGKEQRMRFAGAAMKTYPTPKVTETQVRW